MAADKGGNIGDRLREREETTVARGGGG